VRAVLLLVLAMLLCGPCTRYGMAQSTGLKANLPVPIMMVVDPQVAVLQSKSGVAIREQHDKLLQSYDAELQASRKSLSEQEAELAKLKATLTPDDWQTRAKAFDLRVSEFNQKYQKANQAVEKSYRLAMNDLGRAFAQCTAEIAAEAGANIVVPKQQVVLHDPRMDLTKQVIELLDKRYPSIAFPVPEIENEPPAKAEPAKPGVGKK